MKTRKGNSVGWTDADLAARRREMNLPALIVAQGPKERKSKGYRSKTEASYAQHLDLQIRAGALRTWKYEAVRLALAPGVTYVPDFLEVAGDSFVFVEVKGRKGSGFWTLPLSKVKVRLAAALFPWWKFAIVWPGARLGTWERIGV